MHFTKNTRQQLPATDMTRTAEVKAHRLETGRLSMTSHLRGGKS
jgi:hypothetical protein